MKPTIYLGADHAGWELKEEVKKHIEAMGYTTVDMGNRDRVEGDDYPDFGHAVAKRVTTDPGSRGMVFCGNAQGICMVANKVKGIRAATGFHPDEAKTTRTDDDANVLCMPGRFLNAKQAKEIASVWLETEFSGEERHVRRIEKMRQMENEV